MNSLPNTVSRQRRDCDLNPGPSAPEYSTITTWLPSHPPLCLDFHNYTGIIQLSPTSGFYHPGCNEQRRLFQASAKL